MSASGPRTYQMLGIVALLLLACTSSCGSSDTHGPIVSSNHNSANTSEVHTGPDHLSWLITSSALRLLGPDPFIQKLFDTSYTYVIAGHNLSHISEGQVPDGWQSVPVVTFGSYAKIKDAFDSGKVDPRVGGVVYDNEDWEFTPEQERRDPATYEQLAADLVHQHHMFFISAPATNLAGTGENRFQRYLDLGIAREAARYADVFDIQAQRLESNTDEYTDFVDQAAYQARTANPNIVVLAGISTNPGSLSVTVGNLFQASYATRDSVDGY